MRLTFGKYKGQHIKDVPTAYLVWLFDSVDTLSSTQMEYVWTEIKYRENLTNSTTPSTNQPDRLQEVYRKLCKKYHPDLGGSTEAMQAINEFYQEIKLSK